MADGTRMEIDWQGDRVRAKAQSATAKGINEIMGRCVSQAQDTIPVQFGILQRSIRLEPAETKGERTIGTWGSFDVNYALAVETGDRSLAGPTSDYVRSMHRERAQEGRVRNTGRTNSLRDAADAHYPNLTATIKNKMNQMGR